MTVEEAKFTLSAYKHLRQSAELACKEFSALKDIVESSGGISGVDYSKVRGSGRSGSSSSPIEITVMELETMQKQTIRQLEELMAQESKLMAIADRLQGESWFYIHCCISGAKYHRDKTDPRNTKQIAEDAYREFAEIASAQNMKK